LQIGRRRNLALLRVAIGFLCIPYHRFVLLVPAGPKVIYLITDIISTYGIYCTGGGVCLLKHYLLKARG